MPVGTFEDSEAEMGIATLLFAVHFLSASVAPVDVSGVWDLEMVFTSSGATSKGVCKLSQKDGELTGTCGTDPVAITGKVDDDKVTWQFQAEQGGQKHTMIFDGVVEQEGATIKGKCRIVDGQEGTFTATKR
jgi:hypothetical protein